MGSTFEQNDTLKLSTERGFPTALTLEDHLQGKTSISNFETKTFHFWNKGLRHYNDGQTRVFLVQEMPDGKWLYWGHAHVLNQQQDSINGITRGEFKIVKLYDPEYQRLATMNEAPEGKSYFEKLNLDNLVQFIVQAKKATYASGAKAEKLSDGSEQFCYEQGNFRYADWFRVGEGVFAGQETVFHQGFKTWKMSYTGEAYDPLFAEPIYAFLRECLMRMDADTPFRGPKTHSRDEWKYECRVTGDFRNFNGREHICHLTSPVYQLDFHGGLVHEHQT